MSKLKLSLPNVFIKIDAFKIASIGKDNLYELAEQQLQGTEFSAIEIIEMDLIPMKILDNNEVRYFCKIIDYRMNIWSVAA